MTRIKEALSKLKEMDVYSIILFVLYKVRLIPEYSTLSKLAFVLDKENFFRFIRTFGGTTIKVPTMEELESITFSLTLYNYVDIEHIPYEEATKIIGHKSSDLRRVKADYVRIKEVMKDYDFSRINDK